MAPEQAGTPTSHALFTLSWDSAALSINASISVIVVIALVLLLLLLLSLRWLPGWRKGGALEIDQAAIGVGDAKLTFRPNQTDRQVAYAIWVELSTRKIGLPIDLEDDVVAEIYDSWHTYFSVTRELIKSISVSRVRSASTKQIIDLSIEVLNEGLRPHLTKWQARFRYWYERELKVESEKGEKGVVDPQSIQSRFPEYDQLKTELLEVNRGLIGYRAAMNKIVFSA